MLLKLSSRKIGAMLGRHSPLRPLSSNSREALLKLLHVRTFSEEEIQKSYSALGGNDVDSNGKVVSGIRRLAHEQSVAEVEAMQKVFLGKGSLDEDKIWSYEEYKEKLVEIGEKVDKRVYTIGLSYLCTGLSVGVIIPCMPLLVSQLEIPSSAYGMVVSAFGLSKLLGNIPSGYLVEKYGRKPVMITGLGLCGLGLGAISLTFLPDFGTPWLIGCRFVSGFGVAAFIAGGNMLINDISTALNRTRTIAPVMASFSGGTALGPAIGGVLIHMIGLANTYAVVGGSFGLIALLNYLTVSETKVKSLVPDIVETQKQNSVGNDLTGSFREAFTSWKELLKDRKVKNMAILNGVLWFALSGIQMTLLPLYMVSPVFDMNPAEIGSAFAFTSVVSFLSAQPIAYVADKFGKYQTVAIGCGLLGVSAVGLPFASTMPEMLALLVPLAIGSPILHSTPTAIMSDLSTDKERAQALSLLRTAGDVGLLFGATSAGVLASMSSLGPAFWADGAIMSASVAWLVSRYLTKPSIKNEK